MKKMPVLHSQACPRNVPSAPLRQRQSCEDRPTSVPTVSLFWCLSVSHVFQINTGPFCCQPPAPGLTAPLLSTLRPPLSFSYYYKTTQVKGEAFGPVLSIQIHSWNSFFIGSECFCSCAMNQMIFDIKWLHLFVSLMIKMYL